MMISSVLLVVALALGGSTQQTGFNTQQTGFNTQQTGFNTQQTGFNQNFQQYYYPEVYQEPYSEPYAEANYPEVYQDPYPGTYTQANYPEAFPVAHPQAQNAPPSSAHQLTYLNDFQYENPTAGVVAAQSGPVAYNDYQFAPAASSFIPIDNQYQTIDEFGQYSFGFSGGDSDRSETRDAQGNVRGSYNYIDSEGKLQTQHYVADQFGFRVVGSNLPQGPEALSASAPAPISVSLPQPVQDTPEVAAAKATFLKAYNEAALAAAEAPDTR